MTEKPAGILSAAGRVVRGYAALFNTLSVDLGGYREALLPGCFERSLRRPTTDITAVLDHNDSKVLGSLNRGNLRLWEDSQGLRFELELPRDKLGNDTLYRLNRGELGNMSFQMAVTDSEDIYSRGVKIRAVFEAELVHISLLSGPPAYVESYAVLSDHQAAAEELAELLRARRNHRRRRLELKALS